MLFNSIEFFIFLPIVFLLYWSLKDHRVWQNIIIVISSYIFYGWWDLRFLILIFFTSLCSYISGLQIELFRKQKKLYIAKFISISNIVINLSILGVFKYYNFFIDSFITILNLLGIYPDFVTIKIILPVGISFYTFQALSYSIDVYRKKITATNDISAFFAYICFFPQLVSGPIERATNLLPQFLHKKHFDYEQAVDGSKQILWGFFKKMVIADNCAIVVNTIFSNFQEKSSLALIGAGILFAFQIYGDFSGYSDIAIGVSKLFNIKLKRNFNVPYFSRNVAEFWKRWHISLNTWFVDYIYIPLGGSRFGRTKTIFNTMIIFLISGLWHGANWTFILWGAYHGLLFVPLLWFGSTKKYNSSATSFRHIPQILFTFSLVVIGWIIFRAESVSFAFEYINRIISLSALGVSGLYMCITPLKWILFMLCIEWTTRNSEHNFNIFSNDICLPFTIKKIYLTLAKSTLFRWAIYIILAICILQNHGNKTEFIYFQF